MPWSLGTFLRMVAFGTAVGAGFAGWPLALVSSVALACALVDARDERGASKLEERTRALEGKAAALDKARADLDELKTQVNNLRTAAQLRSSR